MDRNFKKIEENIGDAPFFTPSDSVWEGIEKSINEKEKKRPVGIWFPLSSILLLVVSISLFSLPFNNSKKTQSGTVEDSSIISKKTSDEVTTNAGSSSSISNIATIDQEIEDKAIIEIPISGTSNLIAKEVKTQVSVDSDLSNNNKDVAHTMGFMASMVSDDGVIETSIEGPLPIILKDSEPTLESFEAAIILPSNINLINLHSDKLMIDMPYEKDFKISPPASKTIISAGYVRQTVLTQPSINPQISLSELIRNSTYSDNNGIQLSIAKELNNKWVLKSGIGYYQTSINTAYDLSIPYALSQEIHDPITSTYNNTFNHTLPTVSGNIETELTLRRSDQSSLNDNEKIGLELATTITEKVIYIPIELQRHFTIGKQKLFACGQFSAGYHFGRNLSANSLHSNHNIVDIKDGQLELPEEFANNISSTVEFGIGYTLPIGTATSIDLQLGLNQTLSGNRAQRYANFGAHINKRF